MIKDLLHGLERGMTWIWYEFKDFAFFILILVQVGLVFVLQTQKDDVRDSWLETSYHLGYEQGESFNKTMLEVNREGFCEIMAPSANGEYRADHDRWLDGCLRAVRGFAA